MAINTLLRQPACGDTWQQLRDKVAVARASSMAADHVRNAAEQRCFAELPAEPVKPDVPAFSPAALSVIAEWSASTKPAWEAYDAAMRAWKRDCEELSDRMTGAAEHTAATAFSDFSEALGAFGRCPSPTLEALAEKTAILLNEYPDDFGAAGDEAKWIAQDILQLAERNRSDRAAWEAAKARYDAALAALENGEDPDGVAYNEALPALLLTPAADLPALRVKLDMAIVPAIVGPLNDELQSAVIADIARLLPEGR